MGAVSEQTAEKRRVFNWKRTLSGLISVAVLVFIFGWAIPRFADYGEIWDAMSTLTPVELWSLVAAMLFNLVTYWWANQAAIPGLGIGKAAVLTQTTTMVANTLPAGGAIAVALTYKILQSWGFPGTSVALLVGVTGIWNIFAKLALPILALAFLAIGGHTSPAYVAAAVVGLIVLGVAVTLLVLIFRSEKLARRIGDGLSSLVSWFRRLIRKPPIGGWGEGAVKFRRGTISLVERRWLRLTLMTILSQLALFVVLLMSLRHMGVSQDEIGAAEVFAVYAFSRLLTAIPVTPGGAGIIDLGYIGGLTVFDSTEKAQVVAAVLLFRVLTYGIQIPIGAFTYIVWRVKSDWRSTEAVERQRARLVI